jgi:hypothetical protein
MNEFRTGVIRPVECLKEGWTLIKDQYWLLFGITIVGALLGNASFGIAFGAMLCGIFFCYIRKIDGRAVRFDDLFKGFDFFKQSLLLLLIIILPSLIVMGVIYAPLIGALIFGQNLSEDEFLALLVGGAAVELVAVVAMTCFHTLLLFSFPLVVDKNLAAWPAVKLSARAVWQNLSGVAGLFGAGFLLNIAGLLLCFVGVYLTIPLIFAGNVVAYRKIFPRDAIRSADGYN